MTGVFEQFQWQLPFSFYGLFFFTFPIYITLKLSTSDWRHDWETGSDSLSALKTLGPQTTLEVPRSFRVTKSMVSDRMLRMTGAWTLTTIKFPNMYK